MCVWGGGEGGGEKKEVERKRWMGDRGKRRRRNVSRKFSVMLVSQVRRYLTTQKNVWLARLV